MLCPLKNTEYWGIKSFQFLTNRQSIHENAISLFAWSTISYVFNNHFPHLQRKSIFYHKKVGQHVLEPIRTVFYVIIPLCFCPNFRAREEKTRTKETMRDKWQYNHQYSSSWLAFFTSKCVVGNSFARIWKKEHSRC